MSDLGLVATASLHNPKSFTRFQCQVPSQVPLPSESSQDHPPWGARGPVDLGQLSSIIQGTGGLETQLAPVI